MANIPQKNNRGRRDMTRKHKTNGEVRFDQVRVISDGEPVLMSSYDAYQIAISEGKDLILINELQTPPIVRIEDYNKFLYHLEKAEKEKKKNSIKSITKEVQLSPGISDNDLNTKARKGKEFLQAGDKVKCVIQLRGRQKGTPQVGEIVMLKFASILDEFGIPEALPKLEGGKWFMLLKPRKKN